jgi:hypothetical protein
MNTTIDVIDSMGMINNVVDTLKAGTSAGIFIALAYIISVIVLIVMHIFNLFEIIGFFLFVCIVFLSIKFIYSYF